MSVGSAMKKKKLREGAQKWDVVERVECTDEENKQYSEMETLPENVKRIMEDGKETGRYIRYDSADLTDQETMEYLAYKQLELLGSIKSYLLFFVVLAVIGLVGGLISVLSVLG